MTANAHALRRLPGRYGVARLAASDGVPPWAFDGTGLAVVARREEELSVLCDESVIPVGVIAETGFSAFELDGPLDFGATGVIASIADPLAEAEVPIFVVSTHDTDVVLVRESFLTTATRALIAAGHGVVA